MVLETPPTVFENLDDCREAVDLRCTMWRSLHQWQEMTEKWKTTQFSDVDAKAISSEAEKYAKIVMRLEKSLDPNPVQEKLKDLVMQFKEAMPIVTAFRNDKLKDSHWGEIKSLINKDFDISNPEFTLLALIQLDVNQFQEEISAISL
jgi:dynein heavy chain